MATAETGPDSERADIEQRAEFAPLPYLSGVQLAFPAVAFIGVQLAWAVQIGYVTPHLRKLGLSDSLVSLAWLAGPFSGIIVQPIIGIWSDRCQSKHGRRRPFLVAGTLATAAGLLLFSNAPAIAVALRVPGAALPLALIAFWWLDFSINVIQGPIRALLTDRVHPKRLARANSFFAVANGVGKSVGYSIGALSHSVPIVFGVATALLVVFVLFTVCTVSEQVFSTSDRNERQETAWSEAVLQPFRVVLCMPSALKKAFAVQFFTYLAWFATFIYCTHWVGQDVAGGSPDEPPESPLHKTFDAGVQKANVGLALMSALSVVVAPLLPVLMAKAGVKTIWAFSMTLMAALLISTVAVTNVHQSIGLLSCLALPLATTFTIPWAIATTALADSPQRGAMLGAFNLCQSSPEILTSLVSGQLIVLFDGRIAAALCAGGIAALVGALRVSRVEVPPDLHRHRSRETHPSELSHSNFLFDFSDSDDEHHKSPPDFPSG